MDVRQAVREAWRIGAAVALASALVLVGCSSGGHDEATDDGTEQVDETTTTTATDDAGGEATGGDPPDLCSLFTAEDFEAVTGQPADEPDVMAPTGAIRGSCTYSTPTGFPMVMIGAYNASDRERTLELTESEPVEGLGAEADWADSAGLLVVVDGEDWYLQVVATGDGAGYDREESIEAAELVLANL